MEGGRHRFAHWAAAEHGSPMARLASTVRVHAETVVPQTTSQSQATPMALTRSTKEP
jgi:hypothetical protein